MEISTRPADCIGSIALEKSENRLYVCESAGLKVYDVSKFKEVKELAYIEGVPCFDHLLSSDKFLFGLSETGFISVIEMRPEGKERRRLTSGKVLK